jgi:DNA-binding IclR family transcriptional regulator
MPSKQRLEYMEGTDYSLTVSKALQILTSFDLNQSEKGISELSRELGLSKTSVQRLVYSLERHEFLHHNPLTRKYSIGAQAFRVGRLYQFSNKIRQVSRPHMKDLVDQTGFTCYLSTFQGVNMEIQDALEGIGRIRYSIPLGERLPLHCTATGKAALSALEPKYAKESLKNYILEHKTIFSITKRTDLLKEIEYIRLKGYATNWEENNLGVASVASPIHVASTNEIFVISLGFATSQVKKSGLTQLGDLIKYKSQMIAKHIQGIKENKSNTLNERHE